MGAVRPPRPAAGATAAPPAPSQRVTLIVLCAALAWAASLPALLEHALPHRPGAPDAAAAVLGSPAPHAAAATAVLLLVLLRQGRWYRPWQSAALIAVSALYLLGGLILTVAAHAALGAPVR
jgi:hypothetical protein